MEVTVDYLGHIKQTLGIAGTEEVMLKDQASLRDLLSLLANKYGDPFKKTVFEPGCPDLKQHYILSVNGLLLSQLKGLDTPLQNGDHIVLMPVVTGG